MKGLAEDAEREKAIKDIATTTTKEKGKATEAAEKKAQSSKKAQLVVERKLVETKDKLRGIKLKLVEAANLNLAQVNEIANLKATLEACEDKWYNEGLVDAENSVEPIVYQARFHEFGEGWLAALEAIGVLEDSLLRNPKQIPYSAFPPPMQSQVDTADEEDTPSIRELVRAIDTHVNLKATSNLNTIEDAQVPQPPTEDVPSQQADEAPIFRTMILPFDIYIFH